MTESVRAGGDVKQESRRNLRVELDQLEAALSELKLKYEQFFTGISPFAPAAEHQQVLKEFRSLRKAPFKNSAINFRLRSIENRYQTFNTYWQRVLREKEEGTYVKDVFKAQLRDKQAKEEARSKTAVGVAERGVKDLFEAYQTALKKQSGDSATVNYEKFKDSLLKTARAFSEKNQGKGMKFKIVSQNGKVTVQIQPKKD